MQTRHKVSCSGHRILKIPGNSKIQELWKKGFEESKVQGIIIPRNDFESLKLEMKNELIM